jgi:hypothetical protein
MNKPIQPHRLCEARSPSERKFIRAGNLALIRAFSHRASYLNRTLLSIISLVLVCSCNRQFEYRDLSSYNVDTTSLADGDTIKVIYCSGGPDDNSDKTYFYHVIGVNIHMGQDTVNILVPDISSLSQTDNYKIYISAQNSAYALLNSGIELKDGMNVNNIKALDIKRVVSNTKFEAWENNNYPTVIGMLGQELASVPDDVKALIPEEYK